MFFIFGLAFCISMVVVIIMRSYRRRDRTGYIVAAIPFLMSLVFIFIILDQRGFVILFFISAAVVGIALLPSWARSHKRRYAEYMANVAREMDASLPLRLIDLFTVKGLLKIAYRWGVGGAVLLRWLLTMAILAGGLSVMSLWIKYISIGYALGYALAFGTVGAIIEYYALQSALKEKHPP